MNTPVVSVVIDTYNYGRFVEEAVESVLAQDFPAEEMEVIIVDDGSTDDTAERIRKYGNAVRYFRKENGGQASAFNFGIAQARGEIVAFLDGDDIWLPGKLSRVVKEFHKDPPVVMVYHKYQFWNPTEGWTSEPAIAEVAGNVLADRRKLLAYAAAPTSSLVFQRKALERVKPVPRSLIFMADAYLVATAIFLGPVGFVPECLAKNRVHGENLWFAERAGESVEVLRRRVKMREQVLRGVRAWMDANVPEDSRREARVMLSLWRLLQESDQFRLEPPGRFREFMHLCRHALAEGTAVSWADFAFRWLKAFGVLIVGKRVHYLEGVRTRLKALGRRLRRRPDAAGQPSEMI